eukprot:1845118-Lingulodinium_polyedra.AAC.1
MRAEQNLHSQIVFGMLLASCDCGCWCTKAVRGGLRAHSTAAQRLGRAGVPARLDARGGRG